MITIIQVDINYKQNSNYYLLLNNLEKMNKNGNKYHIYVDDCGFDKNKGESFTELKIIKLLDILKNFDDEEIILYIDAFDTSVEVTDSEIVNKFLIFNTDILYSCERGCFPSENFRKFYPDNFFLNSGTILFKNKKYKELLEFLILLHQHTNFCDQYYHSVFMLIHLMDIKIKIDKSNEIFQCLWGYNINEFEKENNKIKNKITNTFPLVFHGNGDGKKILIELFGYNNIVKFLGFTEDKMGINFMNTSLNNIKVYAEIKNRSNKIIFSDELELLYNVIFFIQTEIKDNYTFSIYDNHKNILFLQEKNY